MTESRAPNGLKAGGKRLWNRIKSGWEPPPEMANLLLNVCQSQDRIDRLNRILEREGPVAKNRWGVPVPHPAALLLRSEVSNFSQLYRLLQLESPSGVDSRAGKARWLESGMKKLRWRKGRNESQDELWEALNQPPRDPEHRRVRAWLKTEKGLGRDHKSAYRGWWEENFGPIDNADETWLTATTKRSS